MPEQILIMDQLLKLFEKSIERRNVVIKKFPGNISQDFFGYLEDFEFRTNTVDWLGYETYLETFSRFCLDLEGISIYFFSIFAVYVSERMKPLFLGILATCLCPVVKFK